MEKFLGKIKAVRIGPGGYQDAMFGVNFELGGSGWGVGDFWGFWAAEMSEKYSNAEQTAKFGEVFSRLKYFMEEAGKTNANDLVGVPIEVKFEGGVLKSWRILKEVI